MPGTGLTVSAKSEAMTVAAAKVTGETLSRHISASPDSAARMIRSCCARWLPIQMTRSRLAPRDPMMAPSVFAA